jgi:hypothetical protein
MAGNFVVAAKSGTGFRRGDDSIGPGYFVLWERMWWNSRTMDSILETPVLTRRKPENFVPPWVNPRFFSAPPVLIALSVEKLPAAVYSLPFMLDPWDTK